MAKLHMLTYCESTDVNNNKTIINNPLMSLNLKYIPGIFSFSISVGIIDVDLEKTHTFRAVVKNSMTGEEVMSTPEFKVDGTDKDSKLPKELRGIILNVGFMNAEFTEEGQYITEVIFDGVNIGGNPIQVIEVE